MHIYIYTHTHIQYIYTRFQAPAQVTSPTRSDKVFSYYASSFQWVEARAQCVKQGGDLATVTSDQELSTLMSLSTANTYNSIWLLWIGLNDFNTENTWLWSDGSNSTYRKWGNGESTGGVGENGALVNIILSGGIFQDFPSGWTYPYFCSKCAQGTCVLVSHVSDGTSCACW
jgi:hypothetical protein